MSRGLVVVIGMGLGSRVGDLTSDRLLDLNSIMFQSAAGRTIKFNFSFFVYGHGRDQIEFGKGQVTLRGQSLESRSSAQRLLLLHDLKCALRQVTCLLGSVDTGGSLLQCVMSILHLDPNLLPQLLTPQLGLAVFQFRTVLVGLGHAISDRNAKIETDVVIRRGVV